MVLIFFCCYFFNDHANLSMQAMSGEHDILIRKAIEVAKSAMDHGNHPFGALLVNKAGDILLTAENTVCTGKNPSQHAEMNLVNAAWASLSADDIKSSILYTSCEPCPMCTGAIFWSGIRTVVFSLSANRLGEIANDSFCGPCTVLFDRAGPEACTEVIGPILEKEGEADHLGFWTNENH